MAEQPMSADERKVLEVATQLWNDGEWSPPPGMSIGEAVRQWSNERFPSWQARNSAQKIAAQGVDAIRKEITDFRNETAKERAAAQRERDLQRIKAIPELQIQSDEDVKAIEAHMLERGIGNYEDGAYSWRRSNRIAPPSQSRTTGIEVPGVGDGLGGMEWMKGIVGAGGVDRTKLDRAALKEAYRVWDEETSGRR